MTGSSAGTRCESTSILTPAACATRPASSAAVWWDMMQRNKWDTALVRDPRVDVIRVHLEEKTRHLLERRWSPSVEPRAQAGRPGKQDEVAIVGVVIRMMVRNEDVPELGQGHSGEDELARHAIAAVDDIRRVIGNDYLSRGRARLPRPWSAARPEEDQASPGALPLAAVRK